AAPGPGIDFISEALRWWDKWMSGIDNGVDQQPQLRAYVPDSTPIHTDREHRPGRWIAEATWPSPQITDMVMPAAEAQISDRTPLESTALLGYQGGSWLQFGKAAGMAGDQAADDARSYTCDWDVENGLEIVGTPTLRATLTWSRDRAVIEARLYDCAPEGSSGLVSVRLFNLTLSSSHELPEPLTPSSQVTVDFPLLASALRFAPGHRLRLSISASF